MILALFLACQQVPETAPALEYDRVACTSCAMMVSDPKFAVQLVTADGTVRVYDDPACLFRDVAATSPTIARMWFRDSASADERWIPWTNVAFVPAKGAPMNGGWAAVTVGTAGAVSFGEASSRVLGGGK